jgi:hypothetical protein
MAPIALTAVEAAEWLATLALEGRLTSSTIRSYRYALQRHFCVLLMPTPGAPNPFESSVVANTIAGICREGEAAEAAARQSRSQTINLTPAVMEEIAPFMRGETEEQMMMWAATTTAAYGMLRPSELLGSHQHPERGIALQHISFYRKGSNARCPLLLSFAHLASHPPPDRFTIHLGATKADQGARNPDVIVAAAPAVLALWRWFHRRLHCSPSHALFQLQGAKRPLTLADLTRSITRALVLAGYHNPKVTGKCFRRGGAAGLFAANADVADIAQQGRWNTHRMVERYAGQEAKRQRLIAMSRGMAPQH